MQSAWVGAVVALAISATSASAKAQCTMDTECKGDRICERGVCQAPLPPPVLLGPPPGAASVEPPRLVGPPRVITIQSPDEPPSTRYERRSPALLGLGIAMSLAGTVGLGIGVGSSGATCWRELSDSFQEEHCQRSPDVRAYVIGGLLFVGGIPLMIFGGKTVPVKAEARVVPWLAAQSGGLVLDFKL